MGPLDLAKPISYDSYLFLDHSFYCLSQVELVGENDGLVRRLAVGFSEVIFSFVRVVTGGDDFLRISTLGVGAWDDVTRLRHGSGRRLVAKQASFNLPGMA